MWWLLLKVVHTIGGHGAKTSASLQGHATLLAEQRERLSMLPRTICLELGFQGPLNTTQQSELPAAGVMMSTDGMFAAKAAPVTDFVRGLGSWVRKIYGDLPANSQASIIKGVAQSCLALVCGIRVVVAEREADNAGCFRDLPPVLPHQLAKLSPLQFQDLVNEQRERLEASFSAEEIDELEQQQMELRTAVVNERPLRRRLELANDLLSFERAWSGLHGRWTMLARFCGGLATVFNGTATVESDFSNVKYQKTDNRKLLTDFSLEVILHSKQLGLLQALKTVA
jgi:hypothetical protein